MAKIKSKGLQKTLIGGLIGGAGNAVYDAYVKPMLPDSVAEYGEYVKVGIGLALPMLSKSEVLAGLGNGLITVGLSNVVAGLLTSSETEKEEPKQSGIYGNPSLHMIGAARRSPAQYMRMARRVSGVTPAKDMVAGTSPVC